MSEQNYAKTGRLLTNTIVRHEVGTRHDIRVWLPARYVHDAAQGGSPLWVVDEVSERMRLSVRLRLNDGHLLVLLLAPLRRTLHDMRHW